MPGITVRRVFTQASTWCCDHICGIGEQVCAVDAAGKRSATGAVANSLVKIDVSSVVIDSGVEEWRVRAQYPSSLDLNELAIEAGVLREVVQGG